MAADPLDVLTQFLHGVVGVGDSDGDHPADELHLLPQLHRLVTDQLIALGAHHRRTLALALRSAEVLARESQPRL